MINDIILNKKESIERCVQQIRRYYNKPSDVPFEEDYFTQDAIAINLQRAFEQCIDLANHVVKVKKLGIPKESKAGFLLLEKAGIIPKALSKQLVGMIGFRNILVHEYHLEDLIQFTVYVMDRA